MAQATSDGGTNAGDTVGKTKDAGWEVGVRTTVPVALEDVWDFLLEDGLPIWLGPLGTELVLEKDAEYATDDDISGRILSYTPGLRVRMTWRPAEWDHDSTLQLVMSQDIPDSSVPGHL